MPVAGFPWRLPPQRLHPTSGDAPNPHNPSNPSSPLSPARSNARSRHRRCVRRPGRARPDALPRDHDAEARPDRPGQPAGQVHHGLVPQGVHRRLARRRAPSPAARRAARPRTARPGVNYNVFAENDANQFRCAAVPARQRRGPQLRRAPSRRRRPHARCPPTPAHPPAHARARPSLYPRFGDLQGTKGNAARSAAIPGASQSSSATWRSSPSCRACARARRPTWSSTTSTSPR